MRVLGIIPARGGSKGVPGKNIKKLNGIPLIKYTLNSALECTHLTKLIVSTDSEAIAEVCTKMGVDLPFLRPAYLSGDRIKSVSVVQHAIKYLSEIGENYDAICLLQPTYPFRRRGLIDDCIKVFSEQDFDCLVTVLKLPHQYHPAWVLVENYANILPALGWRKFALRRQDLHNAYYRDGAVYVSKVTGIIKNKRLVFGSVGKIINESKYYTNIDSETDWIIAEKMALSWSADNG
ncbi:MAG: acylneuraminate cytidylyltransferase family protein [Ignavibacteriaceae bacterium]|nr:acylneuraminate cytidylyltransferase family protein [Ignavibacteriaceae bacterium]